MKTLGMEAEEPDHMLALEESSSIDSQRARFPCCIVWTPLPVISWLIPFIGHIGICREDGVILDFAGPNFVCVDNFTFGAAARYLKINKSKCCISPKSLSFQAEAQQRKDEPGRDVLTWDDALRTSTQEYQHLAYNILTCNCHSFVANNLNRLGYQSGGWNVVNLAALIFLKGQWVSKGSILRAFLPFAIVFGAGTAFGGTTFLTFLLSFAFILVGWFVLGTYIFKNLIHV